MATIPTYNTPQQRTQPLQAATQRAGDTGATAVGQGLARAANAASEAAGAMLEAEQRRQKELADANTRLRERDGALRRLNAFGALEQSVNDRITAFQSGGDLSNSNDVAKLRGEITGLMDQAGQSYEGDLPDDRPLFLEDVARFRSKANSHVVQLGLDAGKAAMNDAHKRKVSELTALVLADPGYFDSAQLELDRWMASNYSRSMTPEDEATARSSAMEAITTALVQPLLDEGEYDMALDVLVNDPRIAPNIGTEKMLQLRGAVASGRAEARRTQAKINATVQSLQRAGVWDQLDAGQRASVIAGQDLIKAEEHPYGTGAQGLAMERSMKFAQMAGLGLLTREQMDWWLNDVAVAQSPSEMGLTMQLSPAIRDALDRLGIPANMVGTPEGLSYYRAMYGQGTNEPLGGQAAAPADPTAQQLSEAAQLPDGSTDHNKVVKAMLDANIRLYDRADLLTGFSSTVSAFAAGTEPLSLAVSAPETIDARQKFDMLATFLTPLFRVTDRFADANRQDLERRIKAAKGGLLKDPEVLKQQFESIDDMMHVLEAVYTDELGKEGSLSPERRAELTDDLARIRMARRIIGAPPRVSTEEELYAAIQDRGLTPNDTVRSRGKVVRIQVLLDALNGQLPAKAGQQ